MKKYSLMKVYTLEVAMELMKYNKSVKVLVTGGAGFIGSNIC